MFNFLKLFLKRKNKSLDESDFYLENVLFKYGTFKKDVNCNYQIIISDVSYNGQINKIYDETFKKQYYPIYRYNHANHIIEKCDFRKTGKLTYINNSDVNEIIVYDGYLFLNKDLVKKYINLCIKRESLKNKSVLKSFDISSDYPELYDNAINSSDSNDITGIIDTNINKSNDITSTDVSSNNEKNNFTNKKDKIISKFDKLYDVLLKKSNENNNYTNLAEKIKKVSLSLFEYANNIPNKDEKYNNE